MSRTILCSLVLTTACMLLGCERQSDSPKEGGTAPVSKDADAQLPGKGGGSVKIKNGAESAKPSGGHSGEVVELGTAAVGPFNVRASRDKGEFRAGGDAPVDVWVDGGVGTGVNAVRFWIGGEDAKGSIKAKAAIEDGKWHTHVEIPSPLPDGSKLWVEIEASDGKKASASFDLKL